MSNRPIVASDYGPSHVCNAFLDYVDECKCASEQGKDVSAVPVPDERYPLDWLLGRLWCCTNILPDPARNFIGLPGESRYADAVRKIAEDLSKPYAPSA